MYALVVTILIYAGTPEEPAVVSSALTTVPGFTSLELCEEAAQGMQAGNLNAERFTNCVRVSNGTDAGE